MDEEILNESIVFLGLCEKVQTVPDGHPDFLKQNILGLKTTVFSPFFPMGMKGFSLAFCMKWRDVPFSAKIRGLHPDGKEAFRIEFNAEFEPHESGQRKKPGEASQSRFSVIASDDPPSWAFVTFPVPEKSVVATPGFMKICAAVAEEESVIGQVRFVHAKPAPLTPDRIDAIKSNPQAAKTVWYTIGCTECSDAIKAYAGIGRNMDSEEDGWIWQHDLPKTFKCKCAKTRLDLSYMRDGLHGLLGSIYSIGEDVEFTRLYERSALESISGKYWKILRDSEREEDLQKFIEGAPALLQCFSPARIFHKSPILSKYSVDFAILDTQGHLILIEIERPGIRLLRKDGGMAAELGHAFTQVSQWLLEFDLHRQACLECIGVDPKEVVQVRGVVIAGREAEYPAEHLARLKWEDRGKISFLTYDDLGRSYISLIRRFHDL